MDIFNELLDSVYIPKMVKVTQHFDDFKINDVERVFLDNLYENGFIKKVEKGWNVAIAVGSRGISNQPVIVKNLVSQLKKAGALPFIVPAMGSHGGASDEGQKKMLIGMGISEETVGAPIRSSVDVVQVGETSDGLPVYVDKYASEADAVVIINRIKPHVSFRGDYESGLLKMLTIGLGKQKGAEACHKYGFGRMADNIYRIGTKVLEFINVIGAVALLENAYHETCKIEVLHGEEIKEKEPELLKDARKLMSSIYFKKFDVLIIDEIGKDISGTGFDTNIVGRYHSPVENDGPSITRIAVLDLTDKSDGNANGVGILDFTTRRVFDKIDFSKTYPNCLTTTVPTSVKIPMVLQNDRHAIQAAIKTCNIADSKDVTLVRIKNTNELDVIEVSENLAAGLSDDSAINVMSEPYDFPFDKDGNLL